MGSSELKTFSSCCLICGGTEQNRFCCLFACFSLCVCVLPICQTGGLLSCCQSLSGLSSPPEGLSFFSHASFVCKCKSKAADRYGTGDYISKFSFLSEISHTSHGPDTQRSSLRLSSASGLVGNRSKSFPVAVCNFLTKTKHLDVFLLNLSYGSKVLFLVLYVESSPKTIHCFPGYYQSSRNKTFMC